MRSRLEASMIKGIVSAQGVVVSKSGTALEINGWNTITEVFFQAGLVTKKGKFQNTFLKGLVRMIKKRTAAF